jgi:AcrR family transcriptional regulator
MGPETSATRSALMDGVEAVMLERGYAAVSARTVAEHAGLKYQVVFYYFENMDELFIAAYRRRMERILEAFRQALRAERPLHAFWEVSCDPPNAALSIEYVAVANHNDLVRAEIMTYGERMRRMVVEGLSERLQAKAPLPDVFTPLAITTALSCIAHILGFDAVLGISGGHKETRALVAWCLSQLEPEPAQEASPEPC